MWKNILIGITALTIPIAGVVLVSLLADGDDPEV
jgi:hypothetical protein